MPLLREDVESLAETVTTNDSALRDALNDERGQDKWTIGTLLLGIVGIVAAGYIRK